MVIASAIALPLGVALGYWRKGAFLVINLFNIGRAIPSLGLILLCIILFGFSDVPVFLALIALSVHTDLTNTWVGIYHAESHPLRRRHRVWHDARTEPVAAAHPAGDALDLCRNSHRAVAAYRHGGGRRLCRSGLRLGRFLIDGLGQRDIPQVISGSPRGDAAGTCLRGDIFTYQQRVISVR